MIPPGLGSFYGSLAWAGRAFCWWTPQGEASYVAVPRPSPKLLHGAGTDTCLMVNRGGYTALGRKQKFERCDVLDITFGPRPQNLGKGVESWGAVTGAVAGKMAYEYEPETNRSAICICRIRRGAIPLPIPCGGWIEYTTLSDTGFTQQSIRGDQSENTHENSKQSVCCSPLRIVELLVVYQSTISPSLASSHPPRFTITFHTVCCAQVLHERERLAPNLSIDLIVITACHLPDNGDTRLFARSNSIAAPTPRLCAAESVNQRTDPRGANLEDRELSRRIEICYSKLSCSWA
ncbi:hypothetical protein PVAR5_1735 [Paecilomyces variotii No. 5]|uniref:Uncharacterized protein n=1 Tax=Byssochlamys spectabilis (strain No. 5 / NBRC 109023) TaxID=1356009 RepID=V5FMK2_BYSSN|nr:hypothetical protein PVAR5_1735 [Paecilomyces variotii No. 5]